MRPMNFQGHPFHHRRQLYQPFWNYVLFVWLWVPIFFDHVDIDIAQLATLLSVMSFWWWIAFFWAFMIPYNIASALGWSLHIRERYVKFITWFSRVRSCTESCTLKVVRIRALIVFFLAYIIVIIFYYRKLET